MEDLGVSRIGNRPIELFELVDWTWVHPSRPPFILFIAAQASPEDQIEIQRFAVEAVGSGCAYVVAWGKGCSHVHDSFDLASIDADPDRHVMSTWHDDESLEEALYFALYDAWPDPDSFPDAEGARVVLAVGGAWLAEVRRLVVDQDGLVKRVLDAFEESGGD
jgi:hypothetical protein